MLRRYQGHWISPRLVCHFPKFSAEKTNQYSSPLAFLPTASQQVFWQATLRQGHRPSRSLKLSREAGGLRYSWNSLRQQRVWWATRIPDKHRGRCLMTGYPWLAGTAVSQTAVSSLAPILAANWLHGQLGSMSVCLSCCRRACHVLEILQCLCLKNVLLFLNKNTKDVVLPLRILNIWLWFFVLFLFFVLVWVFLSSLHAKYSKFFHSIFRPALQDPLETCSEPSYIQSLITLYWHWLYK